MGVAGWVFKQTEAQQGTLFNHPASHAGSRQALGNRAPADRWTRLASRAILILGAPRSGTTWLAKIFDSHPEILYRHEPDELCDANASLQPAAQIAVWLRQRAIRTAAKRPHFAKAWRPAPVAGVRVAMAASLAAAQRVSAFRGVAARTPLPDLVLPWRQHRLRAAIKLVNWDGSAASQTLPSVRCVFILRHPCGQVASVMAGRAAGRFSRSAEVEWSMRMAKDRAARDGVSQAAFRALPEAARLAWAWVAFNEPALSGLRHAANARIVLYEDLCREPAATARTLFDFAGLDWDPQTERFLHQSTQAEGSDGYFDVFRAGGAVAEKWRQGMRPEDQEAVRSVVATSALSRCWPDLA